MWLPAAPKSRDLAPVFTGSAQRINYKFLIAQDIVVVNTKNRYLEFTEVIEDSSVTPAYQ